LLLLSQNTRIEVASNLFVGEASCSEALTNAGIVSVKTEKRSAADQLRCASAAMRAGLGHGLEVYVAQHRLFPGQPLALIPSSLAQRPFCKFVLDEAGAGVVGRNFLWSCTGVRGFHDTDKCHRKDNNIHMALKHAGLFPAYLKLVMCANVNRGPWLGGMFLEKKAEALDLFLETALRDPQAMAQHFEGIAFDHGQDVVAGYDLDQVNSAAADFLELRSFRTKAMSMEMKRFFSFSYSFPALDKEWTGVQAVLEWMHMQLGNWCPENMSEIDKLADVVINAQDAFAQDLAPIAGPDQLGPVPAQPAQEDPHEAAHHKRMATLAELRKKSSNTLHLSGIVMDDRLVQIQGRIIQEFMLVGRHSYAADLTQQKTQKGTAQWYAARALDGGHAFCLDVTRILDSTTFLAKVCLLPRVKMLGSQRELFLDELFVAQLIATLAHEYMSISAWSDLIHAETMPFSLAAGLHESLAMAEKGMQACATDWEAILELEGQIFQPPPVQHSDDNQAQQTETKKQTDRACRGARHKHKQPSSGPAHAPGQASALHSGLRQVPAADAAARKVGLSQTPVCEGGLLPFQPRTPWP
jgi:hypothetical protein